MKQNIKVIISIPILILLMKCGNNSQRDVLSQKEASSKIEKADKHSFTSEDSVKFYSNTIEVRGDVEFPLNLTVDSLKKMNVVALDSLNIVCQSGAIMNQSVSSRGVLLKDVLNKVRIKQLSHADRNFYIVACASDGYKAIFSWAEIFNNPTGDHTYVTFEENNNPITRKGAMVLNCNNDIKTGPRHVNWLKSIEVKRLD